jgi:septal ring factor EnvC (AmiA/AmiB activator)
MGRGFPPSALVVGAVLLAVGVAQAAPAKRYVGGDVAQLASARQQCIAAAQVVQQRERAFGAAALAVGVMERGAAEQQQQIEQNNQEVEQLLGALERLARAPPEELAFAPEGPIDRIRSAILIAAAVPALEAQARAVSGAFASLARVRAQITARRAEFDSAQQALAQSRDALAPLVAHRGELIAGLLPTNAKMPSSEQIGGQASDIVDLMQHADAAIDQRDKDRLIQLHTASPTRTKGPQPVLDPTRPADLRALDAPRATMLWPAPGEVVQRFGEADRNGRPSQGLTISVAPSTLVVAPFDGQVDFVGTFRDYGLILIIRHGGGYHSLLAGFDQVDVTSGQWLLAGEPVGAVPGVDDKDASTTLYMELRRDGAPVDPQSRLAARDDKTGDNHPGNSKVSE